MRVGPLLLLTTVIIAACGGGNQSLIDGHPGAAVQLEVEGVTNAELFCELGQIGGTIGPVGVSPTVAARAFAEQGGWRHSSMMDTGGGKTRRLFVFSDQDGEVIAEVAVANDEQSNLAATVTGVNEPGWRVVGVQACKGVDPRHS